MIFTKAHVVLVFLTACLSVLIYAGAAPTPHVRDNKTRVAGSSQKTIQKKSPDKGKSDANKDPANQPKSASGVSRIQIVFPPSDIFTNGGCNSRSTQLAIRATEKGQKGPLLVSGELEDKDSHRKLPVEAFELLDASGDCNAIYEQTKEIPFDTILPLRLALREGWAQAGNYSGVLRIAANQDTAAQDVKLNVAIRPSWSWWVGTLMIAMGAAISWFAVTYAVRQRQMAGNQILIARLNQLLSSLRKQLEDIVAAGAPEASQTLAHIDRIARQRLPQLLTDKELSVIAGITVPQAGSVTVLDEVEGVSRVVQNGFANLRQLWNNSAADKKVLTNCFQQMDTLGSQSKPLTDIDQGIKAILSSASSALPVQKGVPAPEPLREPPKEEAVVHRVVFTTHLLDFLSFATVLVLGLYVLIWKNPGFGSGGTLLEAFFWGLGLKLGTDVSRLGQSDVRTAFGVKISGTP